jgi:hypothetical protein
VNVLQWEARRFVNVVITALKRKNDRDLFFRWVMEGQSLRISFNEYKKALTPIKKESKDTILDRTKDIMENATWHHSSNL